MLSENSLQAVIKGTREIITTSEHWQIITNKIHS